MKAAAVSPCETCQTLHLKCNGTKPFCWRNPQRRAHSKSPAKTPEARQAYDRKCKWLGKILVEALDKADFGQPTWREQLAIAIVDQLYKPRERRTLAHLEQAKLAYSSAPAGLNELSCPTVNSSSSLDLCTDLLVSSGSSSSQLSNTGSMASSLLPDTFLPLTSDPPFPSRLDYPYAGPTDNSMKFGMEHHLSPAGVTPRQYLYFSDYSKTIPLDNNIGTEIECYPAETTTSSPYDQSWFDSSTGTNVESYTKQMVPTPQRDPFQWKGTDAESYAEQMVPTSQHDRFHSKGADNGTCPKPMVATSQNERSHNKGTDEESSPRQMVATPQNDQPHSKGTGKPSCPEQTMAELLNLEEYLKLVSALNHSR